MVVLRKNLIVVFNLSMETNTEYDIVVIIVVNSYTINLKIELSVIFFSKQNKNFEAKFKNAQPADPPNYS